MVEKLRIAVVGSNVVRIPTTKGYMPDSWTAAPSAWNVYNIVEGLVERGHDVTLFASGNSQTSARLESVRYLDSSSDPEVGLENHVQYEFLLLSHAYSMVNQGRFDIINTHIPARSGFFSRFSRVPTVATLHSVLDDNRLVDFSLRNMKDWQHYVSISDAQREPIPDLKYAGTIYGGVNTDEYLWSKDKGDYLLFAGRVVPEKGPDIAIEVAKRTGRKLIILGNHMEDGGVFYEEKIRPMINDQIVDMGPVDRVEVLDYMKHARALLFPVRCRESFGQTLMEATAAGTPIIAFANGSIPEVVEHRKTGFVIEETGDSERDLEAMVEAVRNVGSINPEYCRESLERRFSRERMVEDYERIFYEVLSQAA